MVLRQGGEVEQERVAFTVEGLNEPITGEGAIQLSDSEANGTEIHADAGINFGGSLGPIISPFIGPWIKSGADDLVTKIALALQPDYQKPEKPFFLVAWMKAFMRLFGGASTDESGTAELGSAESGMAVAEPPAACLELGQCAAVQPVTETTRSGFVDQIRAGIQCCEHMFGIGLPVGRQVEKCPGLQFTHHQIDEIRLHDAAFVMTFLGPGVGKKQVDSSQAVIRHLVAQHFNRIVATDADIFEFELANRDQQVTDARRMHLDTQEIDFLLVGGLLRQAFTVTESNFDDDRRRAAKKPGKIQHALLIVNAKDRPKIGYRA